MKRLTRPVWTLALCIALFPPIWAVLAPYLGVTTGAVALICAGIYVAAGNEKRHALPMSLGFLAGDFWAVSALWIMERLPWSPSLELFLTLFFLGGAAVLIASCLPRLFRQTDGPAGEPGRQIEDPGPAATDQHRGAAQNEQGRKQLQIRVPGQLVHDPQGGDCPEIPCQKAQRHGQGVLFLVSRRHIDPGANQGYSPGLHSEIGGQHGPDRRKQGNTEG